MIEMTLITFVLILVLLDVFSAAEAAAAITATSGKSSALLSSSLSITKIITSTLGILEKDAVKTF